MAAEATASSADYEDVRLVAEVLSRINAALIEKHFGCRCGYRPEFMEQLRQEKRFGELQTRRLALPVVRRTTAATISRKAEGSRQSHTCEAIAIEPASVEDLCNRIDGLEREVKHCAPGSSASGTLGRR